jgi:hypothetical protein
MNKPKSHDHTADKIYFNVIAQSSYPLRLDGWDTEVSEDRKAITIVDGPSRERTIRYGEIGNYSKPQLKDLITMEKQK